jgi:CRP-like cAMP-binding protein
MDNSEMEKLKTILGKADFAPLLTSDTITMFLPKFYPITFKKGELILQQGMPAGALLIVASGKLQVFIQREGGQEIPVNTLEPVTYVGEMALLDGNVRNASVRALEEVKGYILGRASFEQLLLEIPSLKLHFLTVAEKRRNDMQKKFEGAVKS